MHFRGLRDGGWVCLLLGLLSASRADEPLTLSPERVIALARQRAPELRATRGEIEIAEGELSAARALAHNPELTVRGGPREGAPGPDLEVEISWMLEAPGQRRARAHAARSELEARRADLDALRQRSIASALSAYYEALHARGALQIAQEQLARDEELRDLTRLRVEQGDAPSVELQLVQAELQHSSAAVARASATLEVRVQHLLVQIGAAPTTPLELGADLPTLRAPVLSEVPPERLSSQADVLALHRRMEAAEARLSEQRRAVLPSITLEAGYSREEDTDIMLAGLSLPLPVVNQNQGEILRARAELGQLRVAHELHLRQLEAELRALHAEAAAAARAVELLASAVELSQDALIRIVGAFQAGDRSLLDVLSVRREALASARESLDARLEAALAITRFQVLVGGWQ